MTPMTMVLETFRAARQQHTAVLGVGGTVGVAGGAQKPQKQLAQLFVVWT